MGEWSEEETERDEETGGLEGGTLPPDEALEAGGMGDLGGDLHEDVGGLEGDGTAGRGYGGEGHVGSAPGETGGGLGGEPAAGETGLERGVSGGMDEEGRSFDDEE